MAKRPDLSGSDADATDSWLDRFIADETEPDRIALWRLGTWGVAAIAALSAGMIAAQAPEAAKRNELATAELADQGRRLQALAQDARQEARRLTAAVETLNKDRDRLFGRVSAVEQGLDSVTGSIQRSTADVAALAEKAGEAPSKLPLAAITPAPAETIPALASPPAAAAKSSPLPGVQPASPGPSAADAGSAAAKPALQPAPSSVAALPAPTSGSAPDNEGSLVPRTQFGLDLGGASSMEGLRALWKGVSRSYAQQLASLYPVLAIKQGGKGVGLEVHVVAGPIADAATAARLCAALTADDRTCETAVFDGQRLTLGNDDAPKTANTPRPARRKQTTRQSPSAAAAPPAEKSTLSTLLGIR